MSLPSGAYYYDDNDNVLYKHAINVGWYLSEDNWVECVQSLPKIYGTVSVSVYNIRVPYYWLKNHEPELRKLYRDKQEEYRKTHLGRTKKEIENPSITEQTILTDRTAVLVPLMRKVMPTLIANDIVGVQPMMDNYKFLFKVKKQYSDYPIINWLLRKYYILRKMIDKQIIFVKSFIMYWSKK